MNQAVNNAIKAWPEGITDTNLVRGLLRRRFFRKIFGTIGPKYINYEIHGCRYFCNLLDYTGVGHYFLKNNHYEPYITELILKHVNTFGDVLDIGANIGYFSVLCSKKTKGKIYSFEPEPRNYRNLLENIRQNNSNNISVYHFALGNSDGAIDFYVNSKNKGDHRCSKFSENLSEVIKVGIKRLDQVLSAEEFKRIRLIKIDVQGYEMKVCQGMADYLDNANDLVVISELESNFLAQAGDSVYAYLQFMLDRNFEVFIIDEENRQLVPAGLEQVVRWSERFANSNILFRK